MIIQFFKIVIKILALDLHNQAKFSLDNVEIKRLKTMYNNKKQVLKIKLYVFEYT